MGGEEILYKTGSRMIYRGIRCSYINLFSVKQPEIFLFIFQEKSLVMFYFNAACCDPVIICYGCKVRSRRLFEC